MCFREDANQRINAALLYFLLLAHAENISKSHRKLITILTKFKLVVVNRIHFVIVRTYFSLAYFFKRSYCNLTSLVICILSSAHWQTAFKAATLHYCDRTDNIDSGW